MANFFEYKATKVWFTDSQVWVALEDGRTAFLLLKDLPLLHRATASQRNHFEIIKGYAIHWPEIDEDLSIAGFFENHPFNKETSVSIEERQ